MKAFLAIIVSLMAVTLPSGQQANKPTGILGPEDVIGRMIASGIYEGHDAKTLGGMGDAAAVIVTKVVSDRKLTTSEIDSVLIVLNSAFGGIKASPDSEPRTALFVLQSLELSTKDTELQKRIAETRRYIQEQFAKSKKPST